MRYRTEIVVPQDRYVGLLLPEDFPEGRAIVTVTVVPNEPQVDSPTSTADWDHDVDEDDVEWWDEFEAEPAS